MNTTNTTANGRRLPANLRQRGADGFPVGSDAVMREGYGPIPAALKFQHRYGYERAEVHGWAWSDTFGRWSALVTFADGWHGYTYPAPLNAEAVRLLESEACGAIVSRGGGNAVRRTVAEVLRSWRVLGDHERARWFRRHAFFITGHLWKDFEEILSAQAVETAATA